MRHLAPLLLVLSAFLPALAQQPQPQPRAKPDILFILADDLGRNDVGFTGGRQIATPSLDKLAASGAILNHFYVQPVCTPTRAALMTGRYPMRLGLQVGVIRPWATYGLDLGERMLPAVLRDAGYTTVAVGKWHLGSFDPRYHPTARGFDHHYGHLFGAIDYFTHVRDGQLDWYRDGKPLAEEGYATHLLAREAAAVIARQPKDEPLFLYLPFNAVHAPHQVPEKYKQPYAALPEPRRTYAGMLAAMDEAVGQVVAALESSGRRRDTLIVFSSDNGGPAPGRVTDNAPLRAGKGTVYDGGTRVCAFAAWPGRIAPGSRRDQLMHVSDWYPTLIKVAGGKLEQERPIDGVDLLPALLEDKPTARTEVLVNANPNGGALRIGDWKLVVNGDVRDVADDDAPPGAGDAATRPAAGGQRGGGQAARRRAQGRGVELFNLKADPAERTDLAQQEPAKLAELRKRYAELAAQAVAPKNLRRRN